MKAATNRLAEPFRTIREVPWASIGAVLILELLGLLLFLAQPHPLLVVLFPWPTVIGVGVFALGRLRPHDLGIAAGKILPAALCAIGLWLAIQVAVAGILLLGEGELSWERISLGHLVDQLLFFALTEEIIYRAYLLPQLLLKLKRFIRHPAGAFGAALVASQGIFALSHIPHRLASNVATNEIPFQLLLVFMSGLFLCYIYLRSRNLLVAVAVHALGNYPTILFSHDRLPWYVVNLLVMLVGLMVVEGWRRIDTKIQQPPAGSVR